jgi:uncharacterized ion transporter superfamily protein YfcC
LAVLAYQFDCPVTDIVKPTNDAILAMVLAAGVPYGRWLRFAVPGTLLVAVLGMVAVALLYSAGMGL